jgi:thioredoxin reductase (NADPH)
MEITYLKKSEDFTALKETNQFIVLDFFSDECPPCEKLAPIYEKMAEKFPSILFVKAFRQENRALAESFGISGSPTVIFFKDGVKLDYQLSGYIEESELLNILQTISGKTAEVKEDQSVETYDLCIVGNGPAGLSAAVYAARYKVNQVLVGDLPGGLMTSSHKICNYPSETEISGFDLTMKMTEHVKALEVPEKFARVDIMKEENGFYYLTLSNKEIIKAKAVLLATGTKHRHLGLPNEAALTGRGVSYCATCDAMFFANKTVAVIGGSDSANTASLYLAQVASKVYQIYRGEKLRGEVAWIDQIKTNPKITVLYNSQVKEIIGDKKVTGIKTAETELEVDGIFIEVGADPDQTLISQLTLETDEAGYIRTKPNQSTSRKGIWAAGDITTNSDYFKQIITACSEGSVAAQDIFKYLQTN